MTRELEFDGFFEEATDKSAFDEDAAHWHYIPYEDWHIRENLLGNLTGDQDRWVQSRASFEAAVQDKTRKSKWDGSPHLVGIYKGIEEKSGKRQSSSNQWRKRRRVNDSSSVGVARSEQKKSDAAFEKLHIDSIASKAASIHCQDPKVEIPDTLVRNPVPPNLEDDRDNLIADTSSQAHEKQQEEAAIAEQETRDDHEAEESRKPRLQLDGMGIHQSTNPDYAISNGQ